MTTKWFESWFNSPYYYLLYQHRNYEEAALFIDQILKFLEIKPGQKILDLACGRGRHSQYINKKGYKVLGLDISPQSIQFAKKFQNPGLSFVVGDMRSFNYRISFDYIFNLFTSFGYFETQDEHIAVIESIYKSLKIGGILVLDFFNTSKIVKNLVLKETQIRSEITFHLKRYIENEVIVKDIRFEANGEHYFFQERVQAFEQSFFKQIFGINWKIKHLLGDYNMNPYDAEKSDRMIFVVEKRKKEP